MWFKDILNWGSKKLSLGYQKVAGFFSWVGSYFTWDQQEETADEIEEEVEETPAKTNKNLNSKKNSKKKSKKQTAADEDPAETPDGPSEENSEESPEALSEESTEEPEIQSEFAPLIENKTITHWMTEKQILPVMLESMRIRRRMFEEGAVIEENVTDGNITGIEEDTTLEASIVEGILRQGVEEAPHLRRAVGVFPTFVPEYVRETLIENVSEKLRVSKEIQNALKTHSELSTMWPQDKSARENNAERNRRLDLYERSLAKFKYSASKVKAMRLTKSDEEDAKFATFRSELKELAEHLVKQVSDTQLLKWYIKGVISTDNMVGNVHRPKGKPRDFPQMIIPIKSGDQEGHFTGYIIDGNVESVKYYDSFGGKPDPDFHNAIKEVFPPIKNKKDKQGYHYYTIPGPLQKDAHNCGLYMALKLLDAASKNVGKPETLLKGKLTKKKLAQLRVEQLSKLQNRGYQVQISDELLEAGKAPKATAKGSAKGKKSASTKVAVLNDFNRKKAEAAAKRKAAAPSTKASKAKLKSA